MSIKLVVLDVEGVITLPGGGQLPWPLEDLLAVRRFLEQSPVTCVLCSGRQQPYGEAVVQALNLFQPLPEDVWVRAHERSGEAFLAWPSILENGAYFYDPLAKRPLPHPALTPERLQLLQRMRSEALVPLAARTGAVIEAGKDFCISINPPPLTPTSVDRLTTAEFAPVVEASLSAYLDEVEVKFSLSSVDITPRGISKASAVRLLLDWTGLQPEEVLGVGDTQADAAWLREVGWRAAPANGRDALPGMHYYSPQSVAGGLLDILQRLASNAYSGV
ncbi:MAG: HAD family hydrolase [Actinomycetota bacterium]